MKKHVERYTSIKIKNNLRFSKIKLNYDGHGFLTNQNIAFHKTTEHNNVGSWHSDADDQGSEYVE